MPTRGSFPHNGYRHAFFLLPKRFNSAGFRKGCFPLHFCACSFDGRHPTPFSISCRVVSFRFFFFNLRIFSLSVLSPISNQRRMFLDTRPTLVLRVLGYLHLVVFLTILIFPPNPEPKIIFFQERVNFIFSGCVREDSSFLCPFN